MSDAQSQLQAALAAAILAAHGVAPDKKNDFHKYQYASAESMLAEARESLARNGLALIPQKFELRETGEFEMHDAKGAVIGTLACGTIRREMLLVHAGGGSALLAVDWPWEEEKGRPADKAVAAAATASLKYLLRDLLLLARAEENDMDARDDRNYKSRTAAPPAPAKPEPPPVSAAAPKSRWGQARPGGATKAQLERLRVNLLALGVPDEETAEIALSRAEKPDVLNRAAGVAEVAALGLGVVGKLIAITHDAMRQKGLDKPSRLDAGWNVDVSAAEILGAADSPQKRAVAELLSSAPLNLLDVAEAIEAQTGSTAQFAVLPAHKQDAVLAALKSLADSRANAHAAKAGAA